MPSFGSDSQKGTLWKVLTGVQKGGEGRWGGGGVVVLVLPGGVWLPWGRGLPKGTGGRRKLWASPWAVSYCFLNWDDIDLDI